MAMSSRYNLQSNYASLSEAIALNSAEPGEYQLSKTEITDSALNRNNISDADNKCISKCSLSLVQHGLLYSCVISSELLREPYAPMAGFTVGFADMSLDLVLDTQLSISDASGMKGVLPPTDSM